MVRAFGRRKSTSVSTEQCAKEKAKAVLHSLRIYGQLTSKQLEYCNELCIGRFLRSAGNNVKKASKHLKATIAWREAIDVEYLTADEFSPELAFGSAYVSGQDEDNRPVLIVRLKPEHLANQTQKHFLRFLVFTAEVAIASMPSNVEQFVLILDAGCLRNGSPGLAMIIQLLKMLGEHYPERVARAFLVDAPPLFYYVWKGILSFIDLGMREKLRFVFSRNYIISTSGTSHLEKGCRSDSSRNLWTESSDTEKDDKAVLASMSGAKTANQKHVMPVPEELKSTAASLISDTQQGRSFSFASPAPASSWIHEPGTTEFRSFRFDSGAETRGQDNKAPSNPKGKKSISRETSWSDFSSLFLPSSLKREDAARSQPRPEYNQKERSMDLFRSYLSFYRSSYNEAAYRAMMKPPLGGLVSLISPELKRHRGKTVNVILHHHLNQLD